MKRVIILFLAVLLVSCQERSDKSPGSAKATAAVSPSAEFPSLIFASMRSLKDAHVGSIHNQIMGLEGDIPNGPISTNALTLGAMRQSLEVKLTRETKTDLGVRIAALSDQTEYSTKIDKDSISVAGHDATVFGFYFSVPFENKPWSHSTNWRFKVYVGKEIVMEKELEVPVKDLIMYLKTSDDPFDIIDVTHLIRGQTYKLFYQNLHSDLLIAYYTSDYSTYVPFYVGRADPHLDAHTTPEVTISAHALAGSYYFAHKAQSAISRGDEDFPVFGYKTIDSVSARSPR